MASYSISDAIRDLGPVLDKAPPGAVSGEWIATTMQAGVSSREGSYMNAEGAPVGLASANSADPFNIIGEVVEKLDASQSQRFNKVIVRWRKAKIPFMRGRVTLETIFDEAIVPRGPDDPIYETAAAVRLAFWKSRGDIPDGFAAERDAPNIHNQTKWFGPHRRVLAVRTPERLTLATDGLSTPWAGVSEPENGVECELFMEFDVATIDDRQIDDWAHLLITIGDLVADGHRVAREVEKHGAVLFCRLTDDYSSMSRIILSRDTSRIEGLPFGSVPLIRATPIAETEIEDQDLSDDWAAKAANNVLARRRLATNGKQPALNCRILPGLPPYGDFAISFPKPNSFREGFVVEFMPSAGQKWVGNFAQGYRTWGPESGVYSELGEEAVFVVAQGAGYIINAKEKTLVREISNYISWIGYYAPINAMVVCTDLDVHAYSRDGVLWETERISWDGIEYVAIEGSSLTGKSYSPVDDGWHSFRIDLFSGAVSGGPYA